MWCVCLLPSFHQYSLHLSLDGWPGWVDLDGWWLPIPSTNRAKCRLTALLDINALLLSHAATCYSRHRKLTSETRCWVLVCILWSVERRQHSDIDAQKNRYSPAPYCTTARPLDNRRRSRSGSRSRPLTRRRSWSQSPSSPSGCYSVPSRRMYSLLYW